MLVLPALLGCSDGEGEPGSGNGPGAAGTAGMTSAVVGSVPSLGGQAAALAGSSGGGISSQNAGTSAAGTGGAPPEPATGGTTAAGTAGAGDMPCTGEASYSVTFDITWADPAVGGRHYTTVIGAVHSAALVVWQPGGLATPGVQQMAESGGIQKLSAEVQSAIDHGNALAVVQFAGGSPPDSTTGQLLVTAQFPLLSLGSMLAPTPDLFVGLSSLSLCESGAFVGEKTVEAVVYDAGTKDGDEFSYGSGPTTPPAPIAFAKQFSTPAGSITLQKL